MGDPSRTELHSDPHAAAAAADGVWVTNAADRSLVLVDPATDKEVRRIALDVAPYAIAIDGRRAWVTSFEDSAVVLVDLDAGKSVASAAVASPTGIAVSPGGDAVWVVEHRADRVLRLEPDTLEVGGDDRLRRPGPERCLRLLHRERHLRRGRRLDGRQPSADGDPRGPAHGRRDELHAAAGRVGGRRRRGPDLGKPYDPALTPRRG